MLAQSNAINRYVGRLADLYPSDPWQAALCDQAMDAVEDIGTQIVATFGLPAEELKARRAALAAGPISLYLTTLQSQLRANGGNDFADNRLTVADLKVFVWVRHLASGKLDHVPADSAARVAPELAAHAGRIAAHPGVAAYYRRRRRRLTPAHRGGGPLAPRARCAPSP